MRKYLILILLALTACGQPKKSASLPVREFPLVEVPGMMDDPAECRDYAVTHFWDAFSDTSRRWRSDSVYVAGVEKTTVERQIGIYTSLLSQVSLPTARKAALRALAQWEQHPDSTLYPVLSRMLEQYLYDPNSPVRNEDIWQPVAAAMALSPRTPEAMRPAYANDARLSRLNAAGTPATDFVFVDARGRRHTLYGIRAERTLLFFSNPGCTACKEIIEALQKDPAVGLLHSAGRLAVANIYIDEDLEAWRAYLDHYPDTWLTGYDPTFSIRTDLLYNVRAIPSLYLLDADKTVLLKDAPTERVLEQLRAYAETEP